MTDKEALQPCNMGAPHLRNTRKRAMERSWVCLLQREPSSMLLTG